MKIAERIEIARQHHHAKRLRLEVIDEYADDPDVEFYVDAPESHDAPHGVNTEAEMQHSAEPIAD